MPKFKNERNGDVVELDPKVQPAAIKRLRRLENWTEVKESKASAGGSGSASGQGASQGAGSGTSQAAGEGNSQGAAQGQA